MSCVIIYPGLLLPAVSSDPPESVTGSHIAFCSVLLRMGFTCARSVATAAVVSYTAFPPLPAYSRRFISVALSLESPPPDVIRHPCPVEPGLSSPGPFRFCQPRSHTLLAVNLINIPYFYPGFKSGVRLLITQSPAAPFTGIRERFL